MLRVRVKIYGLVQGVGFRYFIARLADTYGLNGWVRNAPDGSVEALFDGPEREVNFAIDACRSGPASAEVENVDVIPEKEIASVNGFKILFE